jgi:hypothetical protein
MSLKDQFNPAILIPGQRRPAGRREADAEM